MTLRLYFPSKAACPAHPADPGAREGGDVPAILFRPWEAS